MGFTRWILLVGTGRQYDLPAQVAGLAKEFGRALAEEGYGLVIGGWPGVDYLAAESFNEGIKKTKKSLSDYLLQVIADKRPAVFPANASYPDYKGGFIITVPTGTREWIEAIKYADAVILLGGEGGTRETYYYANQEQRPVFPIARTGGDAAFVFQDSTEQWEFLPYNGFTKEEFNQALNQPVETAEQIQKAVQDTLKLLKSQFSKVSESPNLVFVSYAHEDRQWLVKIRSALRPLEKKTVLSVWDDWKLRPGDDFKLEILKNIKQVRAAVLIVSDSFMNSEFIQKYELPKLLELHHRHGIKLFWLQLEGETWKSSEVAKFLSINDPNFPLSTLPPAQQQEALIHLRRRLEVELSNTVS
ncbi:toll/interleukin-1 receptor domain-containing protein [Runella sp.]|uniref:toll/interleukin-1 receptor domain-containing protein n=1 Tax=Runella sp. TaxID=1960881 RepID=UPI003D0D76AC